MTASDADAIERELDRIYSLGVAALRTEWRRLNRVAPPKLSRELFALALAYQLQEQEHGGLSKSTRRKLQVMAKSWQASGRVGPSPTLSLKPGARLVREWHGRRHTVTVTADGFEHEGTRYPSLTSIARKINGAHWSGPRFFGLPTTSDARKPKAAETGNG